MGECDILGNHKWHRMSSRCTPAKCSIVNVDWELNYRMDGHVLSNVTVFERSTGEKRVKKWLFKPDDSKITILCKFRLEKNTVGFFILDSNYKEFTKDDAQYLFLNLATRKHFRVRRGDVVSQITRKTDCL